MSLMRLVSIQVFMGLANHKEAILRLSLAPINVTEPQLHSCLIPIRAERCFYGNKAALQGKLNTSKACSSFKPSPFGLVPYLFTSHLLKMSSDLLAEFDSFYIAPQGKPSSGKSASNDLLFLNDTAGNGRSDDSQQWPSAQPSTTPASNRAFPLGGGTEFGQIEASQHWNSTAAQNTNSSMSANYSWQGGNTSASAHLQSFGNNSTAASSSTASFQQSQNSSSKDNDIWGSMSNFRSAPKSQASIPQNDIWGSFNEAPKAGTPKSNLSNQVSEKPGILRQPTLDLFSQNTAEATQSLNNKVLQANHPTNPPQPSFTNAKAPCGEVLFDADDLAEKDKDGDEDDFGEFESVTPKPSLHPQPLPVSKDQSSMLGATNLQDKPKKAKDNLLTSTAIPYPQAPKPPSFQERNPFAEFNFSTTPVVTTADNNSPKPESPVTAWPTYETRVTKPSPNLNPTALTVQLDDDWGDFADLPPGTPVPKVDSGLEGSWGWDAVEIENPKPRPNVEADLPPPTNIPPPSVLLAIFPSIFDLPQSALFKPVANQTYSLKNRILSDPSTIDFLRAYLLLAGVVAHITAGRKLRWKRDTLLLQAMSIGPAAAGGKGGMKLAGVDKTEVTKEDREAAEVVRTWKDQLGRLRSAVAVANSSLQDSSKHLAIPDVSEGMHVKTQAGGLTAPKPCLVCGLKREERVNKVDVDVEDSFGEWWVEHWGHRTCRNFWLEHQTKLSQR